MSSENGRDNEDASSTSDRRDRITEIGNAGNPHSERPSRRPDGDDEGVPDRERSVDFEVNGEEQSSRQQTLTVEEILRRAGASAGIDITDLGSYYLERIRDDQKFEQLSDTVDIRQGDRFLAVYSGRTPVA